MPRRKKSEPSLVARLMNQECGRLDDALLDVQIATVDFVRHCVEVLGVNPGETGDISCCPITT